MGTMCSEVQCLHKPSLEQLREFIDGNEPVVATGIVDEWPAATKWTKEYLKEVAGDSMVTTRFDENGDHRKYYSLGGFSDRRVTFSELLDGLLGEPPDNRHYMTDFPLKLVSPGLLDDLRHKGFAENVMVNMFVGRDSYSPMHYHPNHETLLCQLSGTKRMTLYPPEQSRYIYPHSWRSKLFAISQVDERHPDYERFPKFKRAKPVVIEIQPGQMLFLPIHWWHGVITDGFGVAVACSWLANKSAHHFPHPGLEVMGNALWNNLSRRKSFRGMKNLVRSVLPAKRA